MSKMKIPSASVLLQYSKLFLTLSQIESRPRMVKDIIKESTLTDMGELRAALLSVASSRNHENIDTARLGGWFGSKKDVQVAGMTLRKEGHRKPVAWFIEGGTPTEVVVVDGANSHAGKCQGKGSTPADLATMPTGGAVASDFASDPWKIK
jgi:hypothetical protein